MLDLYKLLFYKKLGGDSGGGGEAVLINKTITSNGTYNASDDSADGFKKVIANVPNTYAAGDEGKVVSSGQLVAQTAHAQVTSNGVVDTTTNNSVEVAVPQGTTITDGIVVKARDANNCITEVDKYGDCGTDEFGSHTAGYKDFAYGYLETVTLHNCTVLGKEAMANRYVQTIYGLENIISCGDSCFLGSGMTAISLPATTSVGVTCFRSLYQTCKSVSLPVLQSAGNYIFQSSTNLETVQIGSVGHPAPTNLTQPFYACTQQGLTITGYQTGANVDALVANYRNNATNATIIIKASEATTYGGNSFSAGDTILTSTP